MLRVVLVGDSHLTDTSPRAVTKLGPRLRRHGFDVVTRSRGGLNTREASIEPISVVGADWAVYCFGTNDAAPWKQVPPDQFARNYADLLGTAPREGVEQLVLGPPPVRERGVIGERTNDMMSRYSELARDVARLGDAHFIALVDALTGADLADDGVHLNDGGYGKVTDLVLGILGGATFPRA